MNRINWPPWIALGATLALWGPVLLGLWLSGWLR